MDYAPGNRRQIRMIASGLKQSCKLTDAFGSFGSVAADAAHQAPQVGERDAVAYTILRSGATRRTALYRVSAPCGVRSDGDRICLGIVNFHRPGFILLKEGIGKT